MQFQVALLAAFLATANANFFIPRDAPDGGYTVTKGPDGEWIHTPLNETETAGSTIANVNSAKFGKRDVPTPRIQCGGAKLDRASLDAVNGDINNDIGTRRMLPAGNHIYHVRNGVVAYICNFSSNDLKTSTSDAIEYRAQITNYCGAYVEGWASVLTGADYIYGYAAKSSGFCYVKDGEF